jgi:molybdenum cofactor cytidylyltransferase
MGEVVTAEALRRVLVDPAGGLKNIPAHARRKVLLNQADSPESQAPADELGHHLVPPYDAALVAALAQPDPVHAVAEPVAGILLAAGEARRFGQPKQLLDYHGKPFVRQAAETALAAGLEPVVVVTGANAAEVEAALEGIPVKISRNEAWQSGQSSSIRAGIMALPPATGACIFLLADQPQVTRAVIAALVERHEHGLPSILAPWVAGKRANPVLFDRDTFKDLQALNGDVGGRALFEKYPPAFMDWPDERLLIDVDTPADLETLLRLDT